MDERDRVAALACSRVGYYYICINKIYIYEGPRRRPRLLPGRLPAERRSAWKERPVPPAFLLGRLREGLAPAGVRGQRHCPRRGGAPSGSAQLRSAVAALRERLRVTRARGFVLLLSERLPLWRPRRGGGAVFIRESHVEAAARLALFRLDFDVHQARAPLPSTEPHLPLTPSPHYTSLSLSPSTLPCLPTYLLAYLPTYPLISLDLLSGHFPLPRLFSLPRSSFLPLSRSLSLFLSLYLSLALKVFTRMA